MRKIAVVTTFHQPGLDEYAQRMLDSFGENWPSEITLYAYAEDCVPSVKSKNIIVRDLHKSSKDLVVFKEKWKDDPKANGTPPPKIKARRPRDWHKEFKWNAIRFAHK